MNNIVCICNIQGEKKLDVPILNTVCLFLNNILKAQNIPLFGWLIIERFIYHIINEN